MLHPYLDDPFEFYGGNLKLSEIDKERASNDALYKFQERELDLLKQQVEQLKGETQALMDLVDSSKLDQNLMSAKYEQKKRKIKLERIQAKEHLEKTCL